MVRSPSPRQARPCVDTDGTRRAPGHRSADNLILGARGPHRPEPGVRQRRLCEAVSAAQLRTELNFLAGKVFGRLMVPGAASNKIIQAIDIK